MDEDKKQRDRRQVYKTVATVTLGFSLQDETGSWEKSSVSISTESGPGYPTEAEMAHMMRVQMSDVVRACDEQIGALAQKLVERTGGLHA